MTDKPVYWIWDTSPASEDDAYVDSLPEVIEQNDLEFDLGEAVNQQVPIIDLIIEEEDQGRLTDHISTTAARGLLVADSLLDVIKKVGVDNIQSFPTRVLDHEGVVLSEKYKLLNIIGKIYAVDLEQSDVNVHPDFPEHIEFINSLVIKDSIPSDLQLFRLAENTEVIVVTDELKNAIEESKASGIVFCEPKNFVI
jgi:hypothetical protein